MPRRKPAPADNDFMRRAIASAAARLMAEDGLDDYGTAKRKAAKSLGATGGAALPGNEEIEDALRAWQSLYQEDEQRERLREMRETALRLMTVLADFRPCLTGSVLDGTAGRYAGIALDLFADSAKDVEIFLLSRNIPYEIADNGQVTPHAAHLPEAGLRIHWDDFPVDLTVYPLSGERRPKRNARGENGRARAAAVAALLDRF